MSVRRLRTLAVSLAGLVIAGGLSVVATPAAHALDAPANPSPSGAQTGIPMFTWDRVPGATSVRLPDLDLGPVHRQPGQHHHGPAPVRAEDPAPDRHPALLAGPGHRGRQHVDRPERIRPRDRRRAHADRPGRRRRADPAGQPRHPVAGSRWPAPPPTTCSTAPIPTSSTRPRTRTSRPRRTSSRSRRPAPTSGGSAPCSAAGSPPRGPAAPTRCPRPAPTWSRASPTTPACPPPRHRTTRTRH